MLDVFLAILQHLHITLGMLGLRLSCRVLPQPFRPMLAMRDPQLYNLRHSVRLLSLQQCH